MHSNKILFVGVGSFQQLAIKQLKAEGFYIIGVDGSKNASGQGLCDEFKAIDFNLTDDIVAYGISKKASFALSVECDPAIAIVNAYNKRCKNNYINDNASDASTDKFTIRKLQEKLDLPHPLFYQLNCFDELNDYIQLHKGEITRWVLKPKCSSGSRGVILLDASSDLKASYKQSTLFTKTASEGLILEQFIEGEEVALDGFINQGELHVLTLSYKDRTPAPYLLDKGLFVTADLNNDLFNQCKKQLKTIFTKLCPSLSTPFHVEMIRGKNKLFIVEFSFRGAGFNVFSKWIPQVTGINTIKALQEQTCLKTNINFTANKNESVYIGFFSGEAGILKSVTGLTKIAAMPEVLAFEFYPNIGDTISPLTSGADRIGHVVLTGNSQQRLKNKFEDINNTLELSYE